ncbi:SDR family oxidoreductase [Leptospira kmetyi]|uniref:dTDP-4-dehydrorhamnose reductase n=1 Tax=Leptospira kmetyi TaxID=408139 RepID=A0AAD0UVU1_9LEPT|nr:SDR family oxidoreductase [Leptospira kmetyi]AYV57208.1 SDR family oxidoreductase [Leptospira kmetyi]
MNYQKVLITGASGLLGHYLCRYFVNRKYDVFGISHNHRIEIPEVTEISCDLLDEEQFSQIFRSVAPDLVIHCAGLTNVDTCENDEARANKIHVQLSQFIAEQSKKIGAKMVHISTDHLWDGTKVNVTEDFPTSPINAYARSKFKGEKVVLEKNPDALIVRTNFFGQGLQWRKSFSDWIIETLVNNKVLNAFEDVFFTPISIPLLSEYIFDSIQIDLKGIYHIVGCERISKYQFAVKIAEIFKLPLNLINPVSYKNAGLIAGRPMDMSLSVEKIEKALSKKMPTIEQSVQSILSLESDNVKKLN